MWDVGGEHRSEILGSSYGPFDIGSGIGKCLLVTKSIEQCYREEKDDGVEKITLIPILPMKLEILEKGRESTKDVLNSARRQAQVLLQLDSTTQLLSPLLTWMYGTKTASAWSYQAINCGLLMKLQIRRFNQCTTSGLYECLMFANSKQVHVITEQHYALHVQSLYVQPTDYAIVKNSQNALCSTLMRLVLQRKGSSVSILEDHFTDYESIPTSTKTSVEPTVKIKCLSGSMLITIKDPPTNHETGLFSGMIYPRGLSKNSTCLTEYRDHDSPLRYKLPLRSCNTMPQETIAPGLATKNEILLNAFASVANEFAIDLENRIVFTEYKQT
uniref:Uncharacterized protein n=1 Tax=Glossina austeni TaxID=7395 RepID=A0A1A9VN75_GLOAU